MSTTAIVIATSASVLAAQNAARAHEAHVIACQSIVSNPVLNTTEEKQTYASCVQTLYPVETHSGVPMPLKIGATSLLIAIVLGFAAAKFQGGDFEDSIMGALGGILIWGVVLFFAGLLYLVFA